MHKIVSFSYVSLISRANCLPTPHPPSQNRFYGLDILICVYVYPVSSPFRHTRKVQTLSKNLGKNIVLIKFIAFTVVHF